MNDGYIYSESINQRGAKQRLDQYMSQRYRHTSLAGWREHIRAGRVLLDGAQSHEDTLLCLGQVLEWRRPPWREPSAPLKFSVLYEDNGVLVVNKPAGLPTMPGGGFLQHTLIHQLRLLDPNASPVHRLGRWTSGAVLCSRTQPASKSLSAQFAGRSIDKRYRALAYGLPSQEIFEINAPIGPVPYPPLGTLHAACENGRRSSSQATVIERRENSFLCDVTIATGRPHQIRIHLASVGHPLVGDPLYLIGGKPSPKGTALPGDPGYHLHAAEVGFKHPQTGKRVIVTAPPPEILQMSAERSD